MFCWRPHILCLDEQEAVAIVRGQLLLGERASSLAGAAGDAGVLQPRTVVVRLGKGGGRVAVDDRVELHVGSEQRVGWLCVVWLDGERWAVTNESNGMGDGHRERRYGGTGLDHCE